jgi:flagellar hook-associated protein 3 FlgL
MASSRITHGMLMRSTLADINNSAYAVSKTQRKLSSGKEISRPSDDPFRASRSLQLRSDIEATHQYERNVTEARAWQEATDIALSKINDVVHRVRELTVQGSNDTNGPAARNALADEVDQLIAAVKQEATTTYGGRYIFAGTATNTPPYLQGDDLYHGAPVGVERQIGPDVELPIGVLGSDFLGDGSDGKLLQVLRGVSAHLKANDGSALSADVALLSAKEDEVLGVRAVNGARQNRLDAALSRLAEVEESTLKQLSETEDADIAKTLIEFSSQQAAYQAALKAGASIVQASLIDFLR